MFVREQTYLSDHVLSIASKEPEGRDSSGSEGRESIGRREREALGLGAEVSTVQGNQFPALLGKGSVRGCRFY